MRKLLTILIILFSVPALAQVPVYGKFSIGVPTVPPLYNPVSNAGINQAIQLPVSQVTLTGSGYDYDGTVLSYFWVKVSGTGGSIATPALASTLVTGLTAGPYQFELTVTDNSGLTDTDTIDVLVSPANNIPPVADAGINQLITLPTNSVSVTGIATDADGTVVSTVWAQLNGPSTATIVSPNSLTTNIDNLIEGIYDFTFTVTDNNGGTTTDGIRITVLPAPPPANISPTANAGSNIVITLPTNSTTLSGSGSDVDGTIASYSWVKLSGPSGGSITTPLSASTGITGLLQGAYQYELTVTDDDGATGTDVVQITVNGALNISPVANAGANQTITLPTNSVSITGTASDADGTITSTKWTQLNGPSTATIVTPNSLTTNVTNLIEGNYDLLLTVIDNNDDTATDVVKITVNPAPPPPNINPSANAGSNIVITLPTNSTTLVGSGSDVDGTIAGYAWIKLSGTGGTISNPSSASTGLTGLSQGIYQYQLTVTDDDGATGTDIVQVTVNGAANVPPTANAGIDYARVLPADTVSLFGSGTDTDGTIAFYSWQKSIASPAGGIITNPSSATAFITGLQIGVYKYYLSVTDNSGAVSAIDSVTVTVTGNPATPVYTGKFQWSTDTVTSSSAGVYYHDSILIKTLWSDSIVSAGTHINWWDGKDDYGGNSIPGDTMFTIKVVTGRPGYGWQGTVGNTSDSMTGTTTHRNYYNCMMGLVFASNGKGYYCSGFSEGSPSYWWFNASTPQQKGSFYTGFSGRIITLNTYLVATDNINVYWAGSDSYSANNSMVFATKVSDNSNVTFSAGSGSYLVTNGQVTMPSVISRVNQTNTRITGMAVQKTGIYLFVARATLNQLQVLNKTTGALVQTLTYTTPKSLCVDGSDNLWMVTGTNTVSKYTVISGGTLSAPTLSISGLLDPLALQVSNDGSTLTVCDGLTSQQVKAFSNSTGSSSWTLGTAGGYATDATVSNSKFYWWDVNGSGTSQYFNLPFVAYQSDGSFWVNDCRNFRVQHYNSSRTYINRIMSLGSNYNVYVDRNNINRVFAAYLEFEIDYSVQPFTGSAGWILKRNWGYNASTITYGKYGAKDILTLSNGRTYGLLAKDGNKYEIVEFASNNQLRFSGTYTNNLSKVLCDDGSLQDFSMSGSIGTFKRFPLTGFDGSGNPQWSSTPEILATALTNNTTGNPVLSPRTQIFTTTTNRVILFNHKAYANNTGPIYFSPGAYHLAGMTRGANNTFLFQTGKSTHRNYRGVFPDPGWFEGGNLVNDYVGGNVNVVDRNVFASFRGEFWKNGQVNKYNHFWDNGLAVGQFGPTREEAGVNSAYPGMAGSVLTPIFCKDANGNIYLWHGDESDHAGLHCWKITGTNTIAVQSIPIRFPTAFTGPVTTAIDLMDGLPFNVPLVSGTAGWTRTDTNYVVGSSTWLVNTQVLTYDKLKTNDIYIKYMNPVNLHTDNVSRDLGTNNVSADWQITGDIHFGPMLNGLGNNFFLEVLDVNGKVLAVMNTATSPTRVMGNNVSFYAGDVNAIYPFKITAIASSPANQRITFTYNGVTSTGQAIFDATGLWRQIKTLRLRESSTTTSVSRLITIDVSKLKLYKDQGL